MYVLCFVIKHNVYQQFFLCVSPQEYQLINVYSSTAISTQGYNFILVVLKDIAI